MRGRRSLGRLAETVRGAAGTSGSGEGRGGAEEGSGRSGEGRDGAGDGRGGAGDVTTAMEETEAQEEPKLGTASTSGTARVWLINPQSSTQARRAAPQGAAACPPSSARSPRRRQAGRRATQ